MKERSGKERETQVNDTIANDSVTYSDEEVTIRNDIYQLVRNWKQFDEVIHYHIGN